jgi:uncharacterized protein YqcC (DUF446 family)
MSEVLAKVREIEREMQRIGYWSVGSPREHDHSKMYSGVSFEQWLQFAYLPAVNAAAASGNFESIPPYRVGLAALRQYDYHSTVEEALPLMRLCHDLEGLLAPELRKAQQVIQLDGPAVGRSAG